MKKVILATAVITVLGGVSLLGATVLEDNIEEYPQTVKIEMVQTFAATPTPTLEDDYENYNEGGNKVKSSGTKKLIGIDDL